MYLSTDSGRHTTCQCTGSNRKFQNATGDAMYTYCTCKDSYQPVPGQLGRRGGGGGGGGGGQGGVPR